MHYEIKGGAFPVVVCSLPNPFFGHVILVFEELMAHFFDRKESC